MTNTQTCKSDYNFYVKNLTNKSIFLFKHIYKFIMGFHEPLLKRLCPLRDHTKSSSIAGFTDSHAPQNPSCRKKITPNPAVMRHK